ncbi:hypothetical protein C6499_14580 [Candidatus Poribacteria bacterium]|nr:MAG: hypothetical protein C6499_14580 [Candidatus Poribacteria bacterium]
MNETTYDVQTALCHLKEAVFEVLSHQEGMQRKEIIDELGLRLPGLSAEIITGVLYLLKKEGRVECCGIVWNIRQ